MDIQLVCFDMDGVIFRTKNFWLELHRRLGTYDEGKMLTDKYLKTDYGMLVQEVVGRLWKGRDAKPYYDLISEMQYFDGVKDTVAELKRKGLMTAIITSGPEDLAKRAQDDLGIDMVIANRIIISEGRFTGQYDSVVGFGEVEKVAILRRITSDKLLLPSQICYVGDDENDILVCDKVGLSIAFNTESEQLRKICDVTIEYPDLTRILSYIH